MTAIINFIFIIMFPNEVYVTTIDPCDTITNVHQAIGCSTVNGRRVNQNVRFSVENRNLNN